ncbi:TetM/TetW/TetO/TetS family tetracycline resistance ribosomal protection protein [Sedimentibacter hydroxybenzoicus DSM 7310]|uniref:TetM/TetW/TetO/TetS family tetracycline resistance ribosomal protection protein n=1 Tax=Sedimentibacter hydroxybenzoicus DSM 7310 TaxID=1123245 RepID=A0A974GWV7_SEDHY|nr:TetM/TetW/TetO/TetS family tetracycline resistance ribosomal protection protein [Sedimentibacter hydroxybenzoicus]NYB74904.1 TetM/TetW/TetO/TetS family tetracycline resistance ribosomal protection protein [Sedimentibacter hydroxybenzoicus DSM 7310]
MKKTIGIFAHVDAGKTTFTEHLLYLTGSIRSLGRVDHKTSSMDTSDIEQKRGITIFSSEGYFNYKEDTYYIIDTPGHIDFSAETERSVSALDYAILLVSGSSGVQAHTITLFKLLKDYDIPTFIFINKTDIEGFNLHTVINEIKVRLTNDIIYLNSPEDIINEESLEYAAMYDEIFMEEYLNENYDAGRAYEIIISLIKARQLFPVISGSALKGNGIDTFLEIFSRLTGTDYHNRENSTFRGKVYKILHDEKGTKLTFIKLLSGKLSVKDEFLFIRGEDEFSEKVNEIRLYNGMKYEVKTEISAGDVFATVGLTAPICGTVLRNGGTIIEDVNDFKLTAALKSRVRVLDKTDSITIMEKLRILESEDPMLSISHNKEKGDILISVMGKIQLEVLEQVISSRFGISVSFEAPQVEYKETVASTVTGYGHFEPLRHFAEVQLRLEPAKRGSGIIFKNECHVDNLASNFQNIIKSHVSEKVHKGVLTGSPITDIKIILTNGRSHIKHTVGGDFREATYRAIRQALEKSETILLEPYYKFEIYAEELYIGRIMSDVQKLRGSCEPIVLDTGNACIKGRGPVESFMEYGVELLSFTKGTGSISLMYDGYDLCGNSDEVVEKIGYDKERDVENTSTSVFCAKGVSYTLPWFEAEKFNIT